MSIDSLGSRVLSIARPPFSAIFLFGSYARGDQDEFSDIDILQVTPAHAKPYSDGKVNVTCYTHDQLMALATQGSMFVKHLVSEGVPLIDPDRFLNTLRTRFVEPSSYLNYCHEVVGAIPIVSIERDVFEQNAHHYAASAGYLLRTYVYATSLSKGVQSFSMSDVERVTGDGRPRKCLIALRLREDYTNFRATVDILHEFAEIPFAQRKESLEAFVVNSYGSYELAVILGLRVLAKGDLLSYLFVRPVA